MYTQRYIATIIFSALFLIGYAQNPVEKPRTVSELPQVFMIGEYENMYSALYQKYPGILLQQTQNDMDEAFHKWLQMLYAMEVHADKIDFDLKGVKVWLQVFYDKSGKIDHVLFFKKPLSKNVPDAELVAFFKTFLRDYQLPIEALENFNHSGSASFPTYGNTQIEARKD